MKKVRNGVLETLVLVAAVNLGCNPCKNLDCLSNNYHIIFRLVDRSSGENLLFAQGPVYDTAAIRTFATRATDSIFFDRYFNYSQDSSIHIKFEPPVDTAYVQLSDMDVDTLVMSYHTFQTRCCGSIGEINHFSYNGQRFDNANAPIISIKK